MPAIQFSKTVTKFIKKKMKKTFKCIRRILLYKISKQKHFQKKRNYLKGDAHI